MVNLGKAKGLWQSIQLSETSRQFCFDKNPPEGMCDCQHCAQCLGKDDFVGFERLAAIPQS
ncbi:hypothetical protein COCSUDRAFT_32531 [Coccomyxa subellipsoidea C-169]|uniref:Uncharacterized protein n=1 Tax=Coccomyxa subellipsoidea (strain C-169) TaxID=574566 RepID=I0Z2X2_COCSC|nr:hypothetical protein COCSUDRAFT_32531 [Coccomyxa subellipsoidea C-169]EIE24991.1 hypothetical protein COCSUDRAFT_32531 [Coccomyxa subellipsoidea C-169]|eukprot:XP_005649535.1 hypothetical protein COCSUDRAFT_32531 [Coccomyxa subellipsoidea C-169]